MTHLHPRSHACASGPNPHSVPNADPGPKSRPKRAIYLFLHHVFLLNFSYSLLLLDSFIIFPFPTPPPHFLHIFFPSTTTTKFLLFPSSTTTTTTFMLLSLLLLFSYQTGQKGQPQAKVAKIRPKRPNSGQKSPTQRTNIVGRKTIGGVNIIEMWRWWWRETIEMWWWWWWWWWWWRENNGNVVVVVKGKIYLKNEEVE